MSTVPFPVELCSPALDVTLRSLPIVRRRLRTGDVLFHAGDPGEAAQLVLSGMVGLEVSRRHREAIIAQLYRAGEVVAAGRLLLPGSVHEGTARALTPCEVQLLRISELERAGLLDEVRFRLSCAVAEQSADLLVRLAEATQLPATAKIASALLRLAEDNTVLVNQDVVAGVAGVARATANAELGQLANRRIVRLQRRRITVLDPAALERIGR